MALWNNLLNSVNSELPAFKSLDEGIDYIMKYMWRFSEDLSETEFYLNTRWLEVRDDVNFQETILHVFKEGGVYMRILEGDINLGNWELNVGGMIIKFAGKHELYERVFLNDDFLVLRKHGDQSMKGQKKYFFLVRESLGRRREWVDLLDIMFELYKGNSNYLAIVVFVLIVVAAVVLLSLMW